MKDLNEIENWNEKQLRSLRCNLNNRIKAFEGFGKPKELQKSHVLFGLGEQECKDLLTKVKKLEKQLKHG